LVDIYRTSIVNQKAIILIKKSSSSKYVRLALSHKRPKMKNRQYVTKVKCSCPHHEGIWWGVLVKLHSECHYYMEVSGKYIDLLNPVLIE